MSENKSTVMGFLPNKYKIYISIDRKAREFTGKVVINGKSLIINQIIFDLHELKVSKVTVDKVPKNYSINEDKIVIEDQINIGNHEVAIDYTGHITDAMHGMYPCYYNVDGQKAELIATQFESHYAREVFPCIDEPSAKAIFDVTLENEPNVTVLGNMPIKDQKEISGRLITRFEETPKMSSYLLAWVVGDLQSKTCLTKNGTKVSVWSTPSHSIKSLDFSLDIATKSIEFYEEYFDIKYPLPKSDHVALPDFSAGAMENWGLITYRESALLSEPNVTSISSSHYIATVIAHELAHQWFGNLVTMKWWNDLWLNESFASLMEYICIDSLHPEWNVWLNFSSYESIVALNRDAIDGVQSVRVNVSSPKEIDTLFDGAIVYAKGAKLLKMLHSYIGDENFRKGLKNYFTNNAYSNTEANDLWKEFEHVCQEDISSLMSPWLNQSGYPVVNICLENKDVKMSQKQFFVGPHEDSFKLWPIVLNANNLEFPRKFIDNNLSFKINDDNDVLILNLNDDSHFITNYKGILLERILNSVKNMSIASVDRLRILHEQSLLAQAGTKSYSELLQTLLYYSNESNEFVWDTMSLALSGFKKFIEENDKYEGLLKSFYKMMAKKQYARLGWIKKDEENENDIKLRPLIIGMMLYSEDNDAISHALEIYKSNKNNIESINPELRTVILGAAVKHGLPEEVDHLMGIYKTTNSVELKHNLASAITATRNKQSIDFIISNFKDNSVIKPQDLLSWYVYLLRSRYAKSQAWTWLTNNWQWIKDNFESDMSYDDFPKYTANILSTQEYLDKYISFFNPMTNDQALARSINMGINEIKSKIEIIKNNKESVCRSLEGYRSLFKDL